MRETSDIRFSLSVSRHLFLVLWRWGLSWLRGQKNHPMAQSTPMTHTAHTHIYCEYIRTHRHTPFFLQMSRRCWCHQWNYEFNIQVGRCISGLYRHQEMEGEKRKWILVVWQTLCPNALENSKGKVIRHKRKIQSPLPSERCSFFFPPSFLFRCY